MSARKKDVMKGWPHAYANIEFEPLVLPPGWGGFDHSEWAEKTDIIRQAGVIARSVCVMDRATLRRQTAKLVASDGGSADGAFIAMVRLFQSSIERLKALQFLLETAEARTYGSVCCCRGGAGG